MYQRKQSQQPVMPQIRAVLYALVHDAEGREIGHLRQYESGRVAMFLGEDAGIHRGQRLLRNAHEVAQYLTHNIRGARFTQWVMPQVG